jgi:hypothetical protein
VSEEAADWFSATKPAVLSMLGDLDSLMEHLGETGSRIRDGVQDLRTATC